MKAAFLDRDGTIIRDYPDALWASVSYPAFLPGAIDALKLLRRKGYHIIVVTNQYLIGEGLLSFEQYSTFSRRVEQALRLQGLAVPDIFYCPHARGVGCACCKPAPGLIHQALQMYPQIALSASIVVGDSTRDEGLAAAFSLDFYGIGFTPSRGRPVASLWEAAQLAP